MITKNHPPDNEQVMLQTLVHGGALNIYNCLKNRVHRAIFNPGSFGVHLNIFTEYIPVNILSSIINHDGDIFRGN